MAIGYEQIEKALASFGANAGGGFTDLNSREYLIRNIGRTTSLDDLRNIVVAQHRRPAGLPASGRDRRIRGAYQARRQPAIMGNAGGDRLGREAAACRHHHADARRSRPRSTELNASLPHGIKADNLIFRQANFIETSIRNVQTVLLEAFVVVAVVLFAFLLNWRTTVISLTAIPVSILITAVVFYFAGLSINTMTLGGIAIAIGELVDDAVVDVENIFRRLRENRALGNPRPVFDVVVSASQEVRSGIVYATVIIVLVFVPLFALSGIEGRLFAPLGQAYIVSILASLVVSITLTPVMAYYLLPGLKRLDQHESVAGARAEARLSRAALARRLCASAAHSWRHARRGDRGSACGALQLPRAFLPPFNEGTFTIRCISIRASRSPNPTASASSPSG